MWHVGGQHAETASRGTWIVEVGGNLAVFGIDAQAVADGVFRVLVCLRPETGVLGEGIEGNVATAAQNFGEVLLRVGWAVGVGRRTELFQREPGLVGAAGCGVADVLAEDGEGAPQGKGLEGKDNLGSAGLRHMADELEIAAQERFL